MKKTALQLLIEWSQTDLEIFNEDTDEALRVFKAIKDKATELLETEREQIEDAYVMGRQDQRCDMMPEYYNRSKQQYYKETYG